MRNRLAIDLDAIERQLKQTAPAPQPGKGDPLAELARIVGQDDPFRALLSEKAPAPRGTDPDGIFAAEYPNHGGYQSYGIATGQGYVEATPALTEGDRELLGSRGMHAHYDPSEVVIEDSSQDDYYLEPAPLPSERRRSRKGLVTVGAVLGVAVIGVGSALTLKGGQYYAGSGGVPVVQADNSPTKIAPQNPGGAEIPNQNKQIYERGQDGPTRIVNREEQPVDPRHAVRAMQVDGQAVAASAQPVSPSAMGEPKRVRTVPVRPDGTIGGPEQTGSAGPIRTASAAPTVPAAPATTASTAPAPAPTPRITMTPQASTPAAAPAPAPAPTAQKAPQRVASAAAPIPSTTESVAAATGGGFAVQLAVRSTEAEAKTASKSLQQKFGSDLEGKSTVIRKAEVNGSTVYRVRVAPLSRGDADALCGKLKASGGQCFVANN
jgi:hypothetical protein